MTVATYEDVAVALGRPASDFTADQLAQMSWWLSGVELFIVNRLGAVANLNEDAVRYVEAEAVAAKVRRGGVESSITVAVDDGSVTRRFEPVSGDDITDEWWNLLDPSSNAESASVRPYFEADTVQWPVSTPPTYPWVDSTWGPIA